MTLHGGSASLRRGTHLLATESCQVFDGAHGIVELLKLVLSEIADVQVRSLDASTRAAERLSREESHQRGLAGAVASQHCNSIPGRQDQIYFRKHLPSFVACCLRLKTQQRAG